MSCKLDVRQAILDNVFEDHVTGRHTFQRINEDTFRVQNRVDNPKTRAENTRQAYAIANNVLDAVRVDFKGKVSGFIHATSNYDALYVTFTVNQDYIEHEYRKLPQEQKTDVEADFYADPENFGKGEGIDFFGDSLLAPMSSKQGTQISTFKKVKDYKEQLLDILLARKGFVNAQLDQDNTVAQRRKLIRERNQIDYRLDGDGTKANPGLFAEIKELETNINANAAGFYMEQDLKRLETLVESDNAYDLQEARVIISFMDASGTFIDGINNPFFTEKEIFKLDANGKSTGEIILGQGDIAEFEQWRDKANDFINRVRAKEKEILSKAFNEDFDVLVAKGVGLKDVDMLSLWVMDITQGISTPATKYIQLQHKYATDRIEEKLAKGRESIKKLEAMQEVVNKELSTIENGKYKLNALGLLGIKGVSFDLFMQKYSTGRDTGKLVSMFSEEYDQKMAALKSNFYYKLHQIGAYQSHSQRQKAYKDLYDAVNKRKRQEGIIMNITLIPEIAADPQFSRYSSQFLSDGGAHKQELLNLLGQKEYDRQVAKQKQMLYQYMAEREDKVAAIITQNGVQNYSQLSSDEQDKLTLSDARVNPFLGVENYHSAKDLSVLNEDINHEGKYNVYIPRKYKAHFSLAGDKIVATDTTTETGNYNPTFDIIKNNPVLSDFHELALQVLKEIHENLPPDVLKSLAGTLPAHKKTVVETLLEEKSIWRKIFPALQQFWDNFRTSWGALEQGHVSPAIMDRQTGKPNYKVNTDFIKGNSGAISRNTQLEIITFLQTFNNTLKDPSHRQADIGKKDIINITKFSTESLLMLSEYLNAGLTTADINNNDLSKIISKVGANINMHKVITEFVTHSVVQGNSYDLFKLLKLYTSLSSEYAARNEVLPFIEIAKRHYDEIEAPMLNAQGEQMKGKRSGEPAVAGKRERAIAQNEDWVNREILENRGKSQSSRLFNKKWTTREEKKMIRQIDDLISKERSAKVINTDRIDKLEEMKKGIGKVLTPTSIIDRLLSFVRWKALAFAPVSAVMNNVEGFLSNMVMASTDEFFEGKHIYYAYKVSRYSRLKAMSGGKFDLGPAKKLSKLMTRYDVLMDNRNDAQKSSVKTNFSAFSKLDPYALNTSVEYLNQSPIMIAMMKTIEITGPNGEVASVWDAMDDEGKLAPPFNTPHNVDTWEGMKTEEYHKFNNKLSEAITRAHGNYGKLRGMKAKSTTLGKILLSLKTWMTSQIYNRFAAEQYNVKTGKSIKGRFRSFTPTSGAAYGAIIGTVAMGPLGFPLGMALGMSAGFTRYGVKSDITILQELSETTKELFKRMIGVPVNLALGKSVINTSGGFDKFKVANPSTGVKGKTDRSEFSEVDARNMRANVAMMTHSLSTLMLYMLVRSIFDDDDDDKEVAMRNVLLNKIVQLIHGSTAFARPDTLWENIVATPSLLKWVSDVWNLAKSLGTFFEGNDVTMGGDNRGRSDVVVKAEKVFLPSLFKDPLGFGTSSMQKRIYDDLEWSRYFKSEGKLEKEDITRDRARLKLNLTEDKEYTEDQINKIVNERYPTQAKLKKKGFTRDEYEKLFGSTYVLPEIEVEDEDKEAAKAEKERIKGLSTEELEEETTPTED